LIDLNIVANVPRHHNLADTAGRMRGFIVLHLHQPHQFFACEKYHQSVA